MNLYEAIGCRHSVREFEKKGISEELHDQILSYFDRTTKLNDRISVEAEIFDNTDRTGGVRGLGHTEAPYYLAIYSQQEDGFERNAGFVMEQMILYLMIKGLGSCYQGGAKPPIQNKNGKKYVMMAAFGYPAGKLRREAAFAKRLPLSELCIFKEEPGEQMKTILKAARLAPSAYNSQPWRFIVYANRIYVFSRKLRFPLHVSNTSREFSIGAMLCHIMLAAEDLWMELETCTEEQFASKVYKNGEYVTTLTLH